MLNVFPSFNKFPWKIEQKMKDFCTIRYLVFFVSSKIYEKMSLFDKTKWSKALNKSDPMIAVSFYLKIKNPFYSFYSLPSHANLLDLWLITWCFLIFLWVFTCSDNVDCRHQTWKEYSNLTQKVMRSDEIDKCVMYACYQILNLSVRSKNCMDHSPNDCMLWEFLFEWILFLHFFIRLP